MREVNAIVDLVRRIKSNIKFSATFDQKDLKNSKRFEG